MLAAFRQSQLWLIEDIGTVKTKGVHHIHLESLTALEKGRPGSGNRLGVTWNHTPILLRAGKISSIYGLNIGSSLPVV